MSASSSAPSSTNPLVDDAFIDLLLYEHLDAVALTELPAFAAIKRIGSARDRNRHGEAAAQPGNGDRI